MEDSKIRLFCINGMNNEARKKEKGKREKGIGKSEAYEGVQIYY